MASVMLALGVVKLVRRRLSSRTSNQATTISPLGAAIDRPTIMDQQCRTLQLTILSAQNLKKIFRRQKMKAYAVAWIDPRAPHRTKIDEFGDTQPVWSQTFSFALPETSLQLPDQSHIKIEIYHQGPIRSKFVGAASIALFDLCQFDGHENILAYDVISRTGYVEGSVLISARISDNAVTSSVMGYPAST